MYNILHCAVDSAALGKPQAIIPEKGDTAEAIELTSRGGSSKRKHGAQG